MKTFEFRKADTGYRIEKSAAPLLLSGIRNPQSAIE
jgi:hypothetical protein